MRSDDRAATKRTGCFAVAVLCSGATVACGGGATGGAKGAKSALVPRDTELVHEECDVEDDDVVAVDVNGDGRPDQRTVQSGSRLECRAIDFNFDGLVDTWLYWDQAGQLRRQESDFDRDGRVDEIALYQRGVLVERHRATTLVGRLDTWQFYDAGRVVRTERDSNGDRYVDQWWEYPDGRALECPLVHSDVDGDGHPDPGATVDICSDGVPIPPAAPPADAEEKKPASGIPVETSSDVPVEQPGGATQESESDGDDFESEGEE